MTDKELLEKAHKDYPTGTLYIPTYRSGRDSETSSGEFEWNNNTIEDKKNKTSVYRIDKKRWAEIVKSVGLPAKWAIKRTLINFTKVNQWLNDGVGSNSAYSTSDEYAHFPNFYNGNGFKQGNHLYPSIKDWYEEITTEQFLEYVFIPKFGISTNNDINLANRWLRCIKETSWSSGSSRPSVGQYVQVLIDTPGSPCLIVKNMTNSAESIQRSRISQDKHFEIMPVDFNPDSVTANTFMPGEYIYSLSDKPPYRKTGDIFKVIKLHENKHPYYNENTWGDARYFRHATQSEINAYLQEQDGNWIPQVGEYAIMVKAGGWGYSPNNNGCLAEITKVNPNRVANSYSTYGISGKVLNSINGTHLEFSDIPIASEPFETLCRKATQEEIDLVFKPKKVDLTGRWMISTSMNDWSHKEGLDVLVKIIRIDRDGTFEVQINGDGPNRTLCNSRLEDGQFTLLPEDFVPPDLGKVIPDHVTIEEVEKRFPTGTLISFVEKRVAGGTLQRIDHSLFPLHVYDNGDKTYLQEEKENTERKSERIIVQEIKVKSRTNY